MKRVAAWLERLVLKVEAEVVRGQRLWEGALHWLRHGCAQEERGGGRQRAAERARRGRAGLCRDAAKAITLANDLENPWKHLWQPEWNLSGNYDNLTSR